MRVPLSHLPSTVLLSTAQVGVRFTATALLSRPSVACLSCLFGRCSCENRAWLLEPAVGQPPKGREHRCIHTSVRVRRVVCVRARVCHCVLVASSVVGQAGEAGRSCCLPGVVASTARASAEACAILARPPPSASGFFPSASLETAFLCPFQPLLCILTNDAFVGASA